MFFRTNLDLINKHQYARLIGMVLLIEGLTMLLPAAVGLLYGEDREALLIFITAVITAGTGYLIRAFIESIPSRMKTRDGFLYIITSMLVAVLVGAIPFFIAGRGYSAIDCWFESASGWTTTGAYAIESLSLPKSLILWKAELNYMGGFVMIFLTVSIFQKLGIGGQKSVAHDLPGANFEKLTVKVSDTAKILLKVYIALALIEMAALIASGMPPFYALVDSLSTISTSGIIIIRDVANGFLMTPLMKFILTLFTLIASFNFVVYFLIATKETRLALKNYEVKLYLILIAVFGSMIAVSLMVTDSYDTPIESLYNGFIQTISYISTSGFTFSNIRRWPTIAQVILVFLPILGGCGFSTSSGLKVHRVAILFKVVTRGIYKRIHPRSMKPIVLNGKAVAAERVSSITILGLLYFGVILVSAVVFSLSDLGLETSLQAAVSCITNNGTGFGLLFSGSFRVFSPALRFFSTIVMISGRLELYAVFVLFSRSFWDTNRSD